MNNLKDTISHTISSRFTPWIFLLSCIAFAIHSFVRGRKLLVRLPGPPFESLITGHFLSIMSTNGVQVQKSLIATYGPTIQLHGSFGEEYIYTVDPGIMHAILVKDKANFHRGKGLNLLFNSVFGGGLIGLEGEEHRVHRKLLNPVFTMKFLRELMPVFADITKQTCQGIRNSLDAREGSSDTIDIFPWVTAAALELIGEAGLGYSFDSFSGKRNEYCSVAKTVTEAVGILSPFANLLPYLSRIGTSSLRCWAMKHSPWAPIRQLYYAVSVQSQQAEEVIRERQALLNAGDDLTSQAGRGRDIMTLLMKANEAGGSSGYIDRQAMIGHMNAFIMAGHETTSTALARILDELSVHQHVQNHLRNEINSYFNDNSDDAHHDRLLELPYLDGVVRETLRLHGPISLLFRECGQDTTLPLAYPVDTPSGIITSIPVKKGDRVFMSITMSGQYEKIWGEDASQFLPERWIGSKLGEVTQPGAQLPGVYSSMMTFGAGSHNCIGFMFAIMELKVITAHLIKSFKFEPAKEEYYWQPFIMTFPYLKKDRDLRGKVPKLPLKVTEL